MNVSPVLWNGNSSAIGCLLGELQPFRRSDGTPPIVIIKLNVDGASSHSVSATASQWCFLRCKWPLDPWFPKENWYTLRYWGLIMGSFRDGLCLAKDMLIGNLIAEMDCQIALNLLNAQAMCVRSVCAPESK